MKRLYLRYNGGINLDVDYSDDCIELGSMYVSNPEVCVIRGTTFCNYIIRGSRGPYILDGLTGLKCVCSKWVIPDSIRVSLDKSLYVSYGISMILLTEACYLLNEFFMGTLDSISIGILISYLNIMIANSSDPVFHTSYTTMQQVVPQYTDIFQLNRMREIWNKAREDPEFYIDDIWPFIKLKNSILPTPMTIFLASHGFDSIIYDLGVEYYSVILPVDLTKIKVLNADK